MGSNKSLTIFITGISGLLGSNLAFYYKNRNNKNRVLGNYRNNPFDVLYAKSFDIDLEDVSSFMDLFEKEKPDVIFHTAAITNVDQSEKDDSYTNKINAIIPGKLSKIASELQIKFVFISSDMVYYSNLTPHSENENINPVNSYARSKTQGEKFVSKNNDNALVVRTNFFGWSYQTKRSFSEWILYSLRENKDITLFHDVTFSPLYVNYLAKILEKAVQKNLTGTYNIGCTTPITKLDFGIQLADIFGLGTKNIIPISLDEKAYLVKRPKHMELDVKKIERDLEIKLPSVNTQLLSFFHDYENGYNKKLRGR